MVDERFVYLGAIIGLLGAAVYARDTVRGNNSPNRMTFLLWGLAPLLGFGVQLRLGVGHASVLTLVIGLGPLIILAASYSKSAPIWRLGAFDYFCGSLSLVGVIVYLATGRGGAAILLFVGADLAAGLPTVVKAWRVPSSESASLFGAGFVSASITIATLDRFTVEYAAFPIYALTLTGVLFVLIRLRRGRDGPPLAVPEKALS